MNLILFNVINDAPHYNAVFCCHRNEIIARLKEDFKDETQLPLTDLILCDKTGS